jgi:hypothetical protein
MPTRIWVLIILTSTMFGVNDSAAQLTPSAKVEMVPWGEAEVPLEQIESIAEGLHPNNTGTSNPDRINPVLLQSILKDTAFLNSRWHLNKGEPIPRDYVASLTLDADQIAWTKENGIKDSNKTINVILQNVADDLRIKASHCEASARGWASLITVSINTVKADRTAISGLEVWYVPKGWADFKDRWNRCRTLSSPSAQNLAPGLYMMRVSNGDAVPVPIGGDGKDTTSVDLLVP